MKRGTFVKFDGRQSFDIVKSRSTIYFLPEGELYDKDGKWYEASCNAVRVDAQPGQTVYFDEQEIVCSFSQAAARNMLKMWNKK